MKIRAARRPAALFAILAAAAVPAASSGAARGTARPQASPVFLPQLPHGVVAPTAAAAEAAMSAPYDTDWLTTLNAYRAGALLPAVTADAALTGCVAHSTYCVKNNVITHAEDPGLPYYTAAGNTAGQSSNVMVSSTTAATDQYAIDLWMQAPFHAMGILDPTLQRSNFGSYREAKSGWQMAATLDVLRGRNSSATAIFPVIWPANGRAMPARCSGGTTACYGGGEYPDPLTGCSGYSVPTGQPIYLQFGKGSVTPSVTGHSLTVNGTPLEHCVFTETSYTNPNSSAQSLGRAVLGGRDGVVIIPRQPLAAGPTYTASVTVNGATHTWNFGVGSAPPSGPTMTLDKTALRFGAVVSGGTFLSKTSSQAVRLAQSGLAGTVTWTAAPTVPWLTVSPTSGTGPTTFSVGVRAGSGVPASGSVNGAIAIAYTGASSSGASIGVTLRTYTSASSTAPVGAIDTPVDGTTGLGGAVAFTGWALDDVEVAGVAICRAGVTGEAPAADARCNGASQVYVGDAVFIDGARPDVQTAYTTYPLSSRAGWGFLVLTNMLPHVANGTPAGGTGTFTFSFYTSDRDGHHALLGRRTITCDNANNTLPFGTLDTPVAGEVVTGAAYNNFGWALTPQPKTIPVDGSTITVWIDGVGYGHPAYGYPRADIQSLFPGLNNTHSAVGLFAFDTTSLVNGLHTISWSVCDDASACTGIGSRYFTVSNQGASDAAPAAIRFAGREGDRPRTPAIDGATLAALPTDAWPIVGQRGWDPQAGLAPLDVSPGGRTLVHAQELDRIELRFDAGERVTGYLRVGRALSPLPAGARLDGPGAVFTWAPGAGFIGRYDLVFVRWSDGRPAGRREVRVTIHPKAGRRVTTSAR